MLYMERYVIYVIYIYHIIYIYVHTYCIYIMYLSCIYIYICEVTGFVTEVRAALVSGAATPPCMSSCAAQARHATEKNKRGVSRSRTELAAVSLAY